MRNPAIAFAAFALMLGQPARSADRSVAGDWTVHGKVGAFQFDLSCHFEPKGGDLGGVCYDGGTHKPHPLTRGAVNGDQISWTYQSSYLFKTFDATYSGGLAGDSIKGDIAVPGYKGQFTARKQP